MQQTSPKKGSLQGEWKMKMNWKRFWDFVFGLTPERSHVQPVADQPPVDQEGQSGGPSDDQLANDAPIPPEVDDVTNQPAESRPAVRKRSRIGFWIPIVILAVVGAGIGFMGVDTLQRISDLEGKMTTKASKSEVNSLSRRVDDQGQQIAVLDSAVIGCQQADSLLAGQAAVHAGQITNLDKRARQIAAALKKSRGENKRRYDLLKAALDEHVAATASSPAAPK